MKILITGIAGAIGSHVAERFLSQGHEVIGIDALKPYYDPNIKKINLSDVESKGAKIYNLDLAKDDLSEPLNGIEIVFHFAAQPGISAATPFDIYLNDNIIATQRLLDGVKGLTSLKGFINIATSSIYGAYATSDESSEPKPTSNYGVTKLAAEQLALARHRDEGLPVASLRCFSVYGPRERPEKLFHKLIKSIYEDTSLPLFEGAENHIRSYTYVSDIVDGCELVVNNIDKAIGQIFNLGTDKTMTTKEGIEIIEKIMGKKARFDRKPRRPGDQLETGANISKMRSYFGYDPKVTLEEGLRKEVEWYGEKIHKKI
jgi:nucleoside-diphosphate-sugar epimerase